MNILVTGVSRGLGREIAQRLVRAGHHVYGISRKLEGWQWPGKDFGEHYTGSFNFRNYDLSDPFDINEKVFKEFIRDVRIDGLVNNAAIAHDDIATNFDVEAIDSSFTVNITTPMILSKYVIRNMLLHGTRGSIVHVSSICAHTGYKGLSLYAATKGAIEAYSRSIAREWGERGIRSNCVVPGFMETDMSASLSDEQRRRIYARTSLGEATDIGSVAETVLFLLSDKSKSITGQNIIVDNGTI